MQVVQNQISSGAQLHFVIIPRVLSLQCDTQIGIELHRLAKLCVQVTINIQCRCMRVNQVFLSQM